MFLLAAKTGLSVLFFATATGSRFLWVEMDHLDVFSIIVLDNHLKTIDY
jgi:hypothetical protein